MIRLGREIQIMKKLQSEEQSASCQDDSGQELDISPSPQSETSMSPKLDTHHPEDILTTSTPPPSQDNLQYMSIFERFRANQESVVISDKGTNFGQQEIARNPGNKSILDKILSSYYTDRNKRKSDPHEINVYGRNIREEPFSKKMKEI